MCSVTGVTSWTASGGAANYYACPSFTLKEKRNTSPHIVDKTTTGGLIQQTPPFCCMRKMCIRHAIVIEE